MLHRYNANRRPRIPSKGRSRVKEYADELTVTRLTPTAEEEIMSWQPCPDPTPGDARATDLIETVIVPRARDLGGFEVRRALPSPRAIA